MNISHVSQERLLNAKIAYTPRNLRLESVAALLQEDDVIPNTGDMLLAKVTKTGHPDGLELTHGRCSAFLQGTKLSCATAITMRRISLKPKSPKI